MSVGLKEIREKIISECVKQIGKEEFDHVEVFGVSSERAKELSDQICRMLDECEIWPELYDRVFRELPKTDEEFIVLVYLLGALRALKTNPILELLGCSI